MTAPVITALPPAPSRSDAPDTFVAKADAHVAALTTWTTEANTLGTWINDTTAPIAGQANTASSAAATAVAAAQSAISAPGTNATSTTSMTIGGGNRSFTIQTGKNFVIGSFVTVANSSNNWMYGNISSYDSGTGAMVVNVSMLSGTGTHTSWNIGLSAPITQPAPSAVVYSYTTFGGL